MQIDDLVTIHNDLKKLADELHASNIIAVWKLHGDDFGTFARVHSDNPHVSQTLRDALNTLHLDV